MRINNIFAGSLVASLFAMLTAMPADLSAGIERTPKDGLKRWSLQLASDHEFDNEDFDGIRISLLHTLSPTTALRVSLGIFDGPEKADDNHIYFGDGYSFIYRNGGSYDADGVRLSVQYMFYPYTESKFKFFMGAGPTVSVRDANPDIMISYYSDFPYYWADYLDFRDGSQVGLGLEASLGLEYFISGTISLLAEYDFLLEHRWYIYDVHYYDIHGYYVSDWQAFDDDSWKDASHYRVGLSFHF